MKILMVCLGNICRSPLAEGIMQDLIDKQNLPWHVDSAGTNGYHNGEAPHKLSQKVALLHGVDISAQRSRKLKATDIADYDLILAMADDVMDDIKSIVGKKFDENKVRMFLANGNDVPDPWYGTESGYHEVYEIISIQCDALIAELKN